MLQLTIALGDWHIPYHDERATALVISILEELQPDRFVQIGDLLDCYSLSRFDKDPRRREWMDVEISTANTILDDVDRVIPDAEKHITFGNHDARWTKTAMNVPAMFGFVPKLQTLLRLKERGWSWTPYTKSKWFGDVSYSHTYKGGKYASRRAVEMRGVTSVQGHTHGLSVEYRRDVKGNLIAGVTLGWCGDRNFIDYAPPDDVLQSYIEGITLIYQDAKGRLMKVEQCPIVRAYNGVRQCVVGGHLYEL